MFVLFYIFIDFYLKIFIFIFVYFFEYLFLKIIWSLIIDIKNMYIQRLFKYIYYIVFLFLNNLFLLFLIYSYLYAGFFFIFFNILYWNKSMVIKWSKKCFFLFILLYSLSWFSFFFFLNWFLLYKLYHYLKKELLNWDIKTVNEVIWVLLLLINAFILSEILIPYIRKCFLLKNDYGILKWNELNLSSLSSNIMNIFFSFFIVFLFSMCYIVYLKLNFQFLDFDIISYVLCKYYLSEYIDIDNNITFAYVPHRYILWYYYIKPFLKNLIYHIFFFIKDNKWIFKIFYKLW